MEELTTTITTKNVAEGLNKWHITNHDPFELLEPVDDTDNIFDQQVFADNLKRASRKISEPAPRKTKTLG